MCVSTGSGVCVCVCVVSPGEEHALWGLPGVPEEDPEQRGSSDSGDVRSLERRVRRHLHLLTYISLYDRRSDRDCSYEQFMWRPYWPATPVKRTTGSGALQTRWCCPLLASLDNTLDPTCSWWPLPSGLPQDAELITAERDEMRPLCVGVPPRVALCWGPGRSLCGVQAGRSVLGSSPESQIKSHFCSTVASQSKSPLVLISNKNWIMLCCHVNVNVIIYEIGYLIIKVIE